METTEEDVRRDCEFLQGLVSVRMHTSRFRDQERQVAVLTFSNKEHKETAVKKLIGLVVVRMVVDCREFGENV